MIHIWNVNLLIVGIKSDKERSKSWYLQDTFRSLQKISTYWMLWKTLTKNQTNLVINYFTLNQSLPLVSGSGLTFRNCTGSLFAKRQTILQTVWKSILSAFLKLKLFMFTVSIYNHFIFSFDNFSFLFLLFSFLSPSPSFIQKQVNTLVSSIPTILPQYRTWFVFLWTRNTFIFSILTPSFFPFLFLSFCSWFIF